MIRASICTGEQVAGFLDNSTGKFVDIMVIRGKDEVEKFRQMYGIKGEIKKEY
ncbi:MAG: aspartate dehydrogenase [Lachnospiraceae bacterium]|nr:aspartate dehydrogenase [Lachnospiraceae bacterium]